MTDIKINDGKITSISLAMKYFIGIITLKSIYNQKHVDKIMINFIKRKIYKNWFMAPKRK